VGSGPVGSFDLVRGCVFIDRELYGTAGLVVNISA
jgi:hypothetical protein